jgi:hypothetical protein
MLIAARHVPLVRELRGFSSRHRVVYPELDLR